MDRLLASCIAEKKLVHVYLLNGIKLEGHITCRSADGIFLNDEIIIFKHAIASIVAKEDDHGNRKIED